MPRPGWRLRFTGYETVGVQMTVADIAGARMGGAAKMAFELQAYLVRSKREDVQVIGKDRQLTPSWLLRREAVALGGARKVALNNASFAGPGGTRWVLLRNAMHFLRDSERRELGSSLSASLPSESAVVRLCARRADVIVVPCTAMAERVLAIMPKLAGRLEIRPHPVSQQATRVEPRPSILYPVIPSPYKNIGLRIEDLVRATDTHPGVAVRIAVTINQEDLPRPLRKHPRIDTIGRHSPDELVSEWRHSMAIYFPTSLESFGYPLAEARVSGHPVIALDTAQNKEIAGAALCGFIRNDRDTLVAAVERALSVHLKPDPEPFDPDAYFEWLLGTPQ